MTFETLDPDTIKKLIANPLDNRRAPPGGHKGKPQVAVSFFLPPPLHGWIEQNLLERSGWTWRHFCEAAVLATISPQWVHPTWHKNYILRGHGRRQMDSTRMHDWTPFLDEIPRARKVDPNTNPYRPNFERVEAAKLGLDRDPRYPENAPEQRGHTGCVRFVWHGTTHDYCDQLARISPMLPYSERAKRRGYYFMSVGELVRQCVVAHFAPHGVEIQREAVFQLWREYTACRVGLSEGPLPSTAQIEHLLITRGLALSAHSRVEVGAAIHKPLEQVYQFSCGFWPDSILRHFVPLEYL